MTSNDIVRRLYAVVMTDPKLAKAIEDAGYSINLVDAKGVAVGSFNEEPQKSTTNRGRSSGGGDLFDTLTSDRFIRGVGKALRLVDILASRPEDDENK